MAGSAQLTKGQFYGTVSRKRDTAGFALSEVVHGSARAFPRHAHERTYLSLLLAGSYGEQVGRRQTFDHRPMSVSVRPAGTDHRDRVGSSGGRFFMVEMSAAWLGSALEPREALDAPVLVREPAALFALLKLYREFRQWDDCSADVAEQLVAALVHSAKERAPVRPRPAWLLRANAMVQDRYRERVTLTELAREAGVHPAYLAYAFRAQYGRTPAELARARRVESVCRGIADARRSLSELAFEHGFSDQAHMTRLLRRTVGFAPGELRAALDPLAHGERATSELRLGRQGSNLQLPG